MMNRTTFARPQPVPVPCRAYGFTLLEMIVVLVIIGIVGTVAAQPLKQAMGAAMQTRTLTDVEADLNTALDRMARDIRGATEVEDCGSASLTLTNQDGSTVTYSLSSGRLRLEDQLLAGSEENPITTFVCQSDNWGINHFYLVLLEAGSGLGGRSYAFNRNQ